MARHQPPDHLSPELLARPEFRAACAARDIGAVFRLAKQWGGVGFTASHLARRCELTVSRVQDYISGRVQAQRVDLFERVADGLHIPGAMLDLAQRSWEEVIETASDSAHLGETNGDGGSSVLRRDFMKLGAGLAAAKVIGTPSRTTGTRVGGSKVVALRESMIRLRHLDNHLGGADTYRLYLDEVRKTGALLKTGNFSGATRTDLLALLAEQSQQAGWAAFDAGWNDEAQKLYGQSFDAAKEADNAGLAGNALCLRSYQLLTLGEKPIDLTERSFAIAARSEHPAVRSLLYQRGAWTYAVSGDAQKVAFALGHAGEALDETGETVESPDWAQWAHNQTELEIISGRCWTELHRPLRAVPALESAMSKYDDSHARDKALYLSWLADAYLDAGEIEHAAASLERAYELAENVASARPQKRFNQVLQRFQPHSSVPGISDLLARGLQDPFDVRS